MVAYCRSAAERSRCHLSVRQRKQLSPSFEMHTHEHRYVGQASDEHMSSRCSSLLSLGNYSFVDVLVNTPHIPFFNIKTSRRHITRCRFSFLTWGKHLLLQTHTHYAVFSHIPVWTKNRYLHMFSLRSRPQSQ